MNSAKSLSNLSCRFGLKLTRQFGNVCGNSSTTKQCLKRTKPQDPLHLISRLTLKQQRTRYLGLGWKKKRSMKQNRASKNKLTPNRTVDFHEGPSAIWWQNENLFNNVEAIEENGRVCVNLVPSLSPGTELMQTPC